MNHQIMINLKPVGDLTTEQDANAWTQVLTSHFPDDVIGWASRAGDTELLNWLEAGMQTSLGGGPWYEVAAAVHLGQSLRKMIAKAMRRSR